MHHLLQKEIFCGLIFRARLVAARNLLSYAQTSLETETIPMLKYLNAWKVSIILEDTLNEVFIILLLNGLLYVFFSTMFVVIDFIGWLYFCLDTHLERGHIIFLFFYHTLVKKCYKRCENFAEKSIDIMLFRREV